MERSLPTNAFAPGRNPGIRTNSTVPNKCLTWSLGAFYGDTDNDGDSNFDDVTNADLTLRITGLPVYADSGEKLLHLGLGYSHQFRDEGKTTARYRTRSESHLTDARLVDTGRIDLDNANLLNPELAVVWGAFSTKIIKSHMRQDHIKWNQKYRKESYSTEAASIVKKFYQLAPGKKALDIAAGNGRNSVLLTQKGFSVDAVDISEVGLRKFASRYPNISAICADLDQFEIAPAHYDLIVNVKFLNRRLFPYIQEGLKPGGVVIFDTLLGTASIKGTTEHCRDYLLRVNELLHAFLTMRIIYYREARDTGKNHSDEMATLVAVRQ